MKSKAPMVIVAVIWTIIGLAALTVLIRLVNGNLALPNFDLAREANVMLYDKTLSDNVDRLSIDWISGGVTVKPSEDGLIHIVERASEQMPERKWARITQDGANLTIRSQNKSIFIFFWHTPLSTIEIRLPEATYESLRLTATSGSNRISQIGFAEFKAEITSGELVVQDSQIDSLDLEMTSGESDFSNISTQTARFESTSGDLTFVGSIAGKLSSEMTSGEQTFNLSQSAPKAINLSMTSGSAEINLPENPGFTLELEKTAGDFTADFQHTQDSDRYIYQNGENRYQAEITSGELLFSVR